MVANRLAQALSPYLRQHAGNPVHWQPWDAQSLALARQKDKPILLSVGYAACHWCHVMAHESFADADTAAVMNEHFVNIKVDREERPDIDRIYQAAHYIFVQRAGGWPLTMFLTPEGTPFFGGTYFPRDSGRGLPSFVSVMEKVAQAWRQQRTAIEEQNARVLPMLRSLDVHETSAGVMNEAPVQEAMRVFDDHIDRVRGGFRGAPKFPHPVEMEFCLAAASARNNQSLLAGVEVSLHKMAAGGLADHLAGGFFRYSVDEYWAIPHFEKMLYDNGLLLSLFAEGARVFDSAELTQAAAGIAQWALAEMRHEDGGFYSSLDADSEGGEGAFYVWSLAAIKEQLPAAEYAVVASHFGLEAGANFEGHYHLARRQTGAQTAAAIGVCEQTCVEQLTAAQRRLLSAREQRPRPATDDKILAAWNGLMIRGLARAGRIMQRPQWVAAAHAALAFAADKMAEEGRLFAVWRDGQRGVPAFLDDCAFMLEAALELLRAEFRAETLAFAGAMAEQLCRHFEDKENGGFFFTAADGERLIRRTKPIDDNAIPAGNGVAARALLLLSWLTGEQQWAVAGERTLTAFYGALAKQAAGCASLLGALQYYLSPPPLLLLTGETAVCEEWRKSLARRPMDLLIFILPADSSDLPETLQKPPPASGGRGYLCTGFSCLPAADSLTELRRLLA